MPHLDPTQPQLGHRAPSERGVTPRPRRGFTIPRPDFLPDPLMQVLENIVDPSERLPGGLEVSPTGGALGLLAAVGLAAAPAVGLPATVPAIAGAAGAVASPLARVLGARPFRPLRAGAITAGTAIAGAGLTGQFSGGETPVPTEAGIPAGEAPVLPTGEPLTPKQQSLLERANALSASGDPEGALALLNNENFGIPGSDDVPSGGLPPIEFVQQDIPGIGPIFGFGFTTIDPITKQPVPNFLDAPIISREVQARIADLEATTRVREADIAQQQFLQEQRPFEQLLAALPALQQFQQFSATPAGRILQESLGGVSLPDLLLEGLGFGASGGAPRSGTGRIEAGQVEPDVAQLFNIPDLPAMLAGLDPTEREGQFAAFGQETGEARRDIVPGISLESLAFQGAPRRSFVSSLPPEQQDVFSLLRSIVG